MPKLELSNPQLTTKGSSDHFTADGTKYNKEESFRVFLKPINPDFLKGSKKLNNTRGRVSEEELKEIKGVVNFPITFDSEEDSQHYTQNSSIIEKNNNKAQQSEKYTYLDPNDSTKQCINIEEMCALAKKNKDGITIAMPLKDGNNSGYYQLMHFEPNGEVTIIPPEEKLPVGVKSTISEKTLQDINAHNQAKTQHTEVTPRPTAATPKFPTGSPAAQASPNHHI